ncbi:MAG: efflux RND transporter periplasmic adaptor subunit [Acidobacteriota bacterium]|nr:MAG: efflux RND transporter periplasmic adaptor subunit [Acidobacteriota bacterium]
MKRAWLLWMVLVLPVIQADEAVRVVELDAAAVARAGIVVRPVLERTFGEQIRIVGEIVRSPGTTVTLRAILHSRILEVLVSPGERVRANQSLVLLHSHELHQMEAELITLEEKRKLLESRLEAGRQLYAIDGISRVELEQREQQLMATKIEIDQRRHELIDLGYSAQQIEALLARREAEGRLMLRAPESGVMLELLVQRHDWVQEFSPLLVVGDPAEIELSVQIPPAESSRVRPGDTVEFVPVGQPELASRARVVTRVPTVDPTTRTVALRAQIVERADGLYPGLFVEGVLTHGSARSSASVPESAVTRLGEQDYVFVRTGGGRFEARPVSLGRFNDTRYEIKQGVVPGEQVVVQGVFVLKSVLITGQGGE